MTYAFDRFIESYHNPDNREGPALSFLDRINDGERKEVEELALRDLTLDKITPIRILSHIRSQKAFAPLVEMLPQARGSTRIHIAKALWRINKYEPALSILCETVTNPGASQDSKIYAAIALGEIKEKSSIEALGVALKDEDFQVRPKAERALVRVLGLQEEYQVLDQERKAAPTVDERKKLSGKKHKLVETALEEYLKRN